MRCVLLMLTVVVLAALKPFVAAQQPKPPELALKKTGHKGPVRCMALSSDGKYVVTGADDGTAILWRAADGMKLRTFSDQAPNPSPDPDDDRVSIPCVAVNGNASLIVTGHAVYGSRDGKAILWDAASGKKLQTFKGRVLSVAMSADGKHLVTGDSWVTNGWETATVWETVGGKKLHTLKGSSRMGGLTHAVSSVEMSGDGQYILTASKNQAAAILWDRASGKELQTFQDYRSGTWRATISSDGKHVLTATRKDNVTSLTLWDATNGQKRHTFNVDLTEVTGAGLSGDGKFVAARDTFRASLWDSTNGKKLQTFPGGALDVRAVALSGDGKQLLLGGFPVAILWDTTTGKKVQSYPEHLSR